ncbi:MAG: 3-deoxy-8-phosphooctulonate synthase [Myxococcales bacterium]|nr:3-deoxy-8-phosphooctulonate synthase [Myxococcales bacterium]
MIELCGQKVGEGQPLFIIAGPDVIESEEMVLRHASRVREVCEKLGVAFAFKASFDKANRTSGKSFRGPGLSEGLRIFRRLKREVGVPLLTDVHEPWQAEKAAEVAEVLQVPAFLCRQTDLIAAVARTGRGVNLKKGQFVAPKDMAQQAQKAFDQGNRNVLVTERGSSFGYHDLVVDMRGLVWMREAGLSVCFDATHSVQLPSAGEGETAGERKLIAHLARAAAAAGIDALFAEIHEEPEKALCDGPCSLTFEAFASLLREVLAVRRALGQAG